MHSQKPNGMNILLIGDDRSLGEGLQAFLHNNGFTCIWERDITDIKHIWRSASLAILDRQILGKDSTRLLPGLLTIKALPVIILTTCADVEEKIAALEAGARDYITKPFAHIELLARIRAQIRPLGEGNLESGELLLVPAKRLVFWKGQNISLTHKEFELLLILVQMAGRVFTREELLNQVWGYKKFPSTRTIDMHILQLRRKIPNIKISTIHGVGYRLADDVHPDI